MASLRAIALGGISPAAVTAASEVLRQAPPRPAMWPQDPNAPAPELFRCLTCSLEAVPGSAYCKAHLWPPHHLRICEQKSESPDGTISCVREALPGLKYCVHHHIDDRLFDLSGS